MWPSVSSGASDLSGQDSHAEQQTGFRKFSQWDTVFDADRDKPFSVTITGCKPKTLYARAIKGTFTNEVMKKSLLSFLIANFDLQNGMIMAFKLHLSENQVLHVGVFPDKQTADKAGEAAKPVVAQITQMGAKHEVMAGPLTDFMLAGDVTLDQLTGNTNWHKIS